jgi:hypothetical protein
LRIVSYFSRCEKISADIDKALAVIYLVDHTLTALDNDTMFEQGYAELAPVAISGD